MIEKYDRLATSVSTTLAGTLNVGLISGFTPTAGNSFTIMTYNSATGSFSTVSLPTLTTGRYWSPVAYNATALVLSVAACPTITLSPASLPTGTQGAAYTQTIIASGGTGTYLYAVTAGALPNGLNLASGGTLSGSPTAADRTTSP